MACALHASLGVLVVGVFLPPTSGRGRWVVRVLSLAGALALGWVLFKVGAYVSGLPIDGRWKAVYFVVTVSSFWAAIVVGIGILSPRFNTAAFDRIAIVVMSGVAAFGLTTVVSVIAPRRGHPGPAGRRRQGPDRHPGDHHRRGRHVPGAR